MVRKPLLAIAVASLVLLSPTAHAVDADAAIALARQNNCFKCHAVDKDKDGPAYRKVAQKYRGNANGEAWLVDHVTAGEKVEFPDGHEESHKIIKTSPPKDMVQIRNLVGWILSQ